MVGNIIEGIVIFVGMLVLGEVFHVGENLIWYCGIVGLIGWVSICVFVVCFSMYASSRGVCRSCVGLVWLCTHIIDVREICLVVIFRPFWGQCV